MDTLLKMSADSHQFFLGMIAGGAVLFIVAGVGLFILWLVLGKFFVKKKDHHRKNDTAVNDLILKNQKEHGELKNTLVKVESTVSSIHEKQSEMFENVAWKDQVNTQIDGMEKRIELSEKISLQATEAMNNVATALAERK